MGSVASRAIRRPPNRLSLSIKGSNAGEFDLWRAGHAPLFEMDAESAAARASFRAGLTSYNLANVLIIDGYSSAETLDRSARTIARSNIDHISLTVHTQGGFSLEAEGRVFEIKTGDICVLDMTRRSRLRSSDYKSLTLVLPRTLLEPHVGNLDALHGKVLPTGNSLNTMLAAHMRLLYAQAPSLDLSASHAAARGTAALVAAFTGAWSDGREMIAQAAARASLEACRTMIEAHLHDQRLGPEFLCDRLGVSRAKLYRMFKQLGGVTWYIQRRRLVRAYRIIVDPMHGRERIGAIAARCGFGNASVFNRAFRQVHGMSPTELRMASLSGELDETELSGDQAYRTMGRWLHGIETAAT